MLAKKELILSAGAIDISKILLFSGIGPKAELSKMGITWLENIPAVGQNLHDRLFLQLVTVRKPGSANRTSYLMSSPEAVNEARKQWMDYETGPFSNFLLPQMIGYLKSTAVVESKEFELLGPETKRAT